MAFSRRLSSLRLYVQRHGARRRSVDSRRRPGFRRRSGCPDLSTTADLFGVDLSGPDLSQPDLRKPTDLRPPNDLLPAPDLLPPPDLSPTPDLADPCGPSLMVPAGAIAAHCSIGDTITVDGALSDWPAGYFSNSDTHATAAISANTASWSANESTNDKNISATFAVRWDNTALYVAAHISDDATVTFTSANNDQIWKGDSIEVYIRSATAGGAYTTSDGQYVFDSANNSPALPYVGERRRRSDRREVCRAPPPARRDPTGTSSSRFRGRSSAARRPWAASWASISLSRL